MSARSKETRSVEARGARARAPFSGDPKSPSSLIALSGFRPGVVASLLAIVDIAALAATAASRSV